MTSLFHCHRAYNEAVILQSPSHLLKLCIRGIRMKKGERETIGVSLLLTEAAEKEGRAADFQRLRSGWYHIRRNSYVRNAPHLEESYSTA